MEELINSGHIIPVIAILCTFTWLTLTTLGGLVAKSFSVYRTTRLKERMLEQGLSVAEIERIVNCGTGSAGCSKKRQKQGAQPVSEQFLNTHYNG